MKLACKTRLLAMTKERVALVPIRVKLLVLAPPVHELNRNLEDKGAAVTLYVLPISNGAWFFWPVILPPAVVCRLSG